MWTLVRLVTSYLDLDGVFPRSILQEPRGSGERHGSPSTEFVQLLFVLAHRGVSFFPH